MLCVCVVWVREPMQERIEPSQLRCAMGDFASSVVGTNTASTFPRLPILSQRRHTCTTHFRTIVGSTSLQLFVHDGGRRSLHQWV